MKKMFNLIIAIFCSILSSCSNDMIYAKFELNKVRSSNYSHYNIVFVAVGGMSIGGCTPIRKFINFPYKKNNIEYVLVGDKIDFMFSNMLIDASCPEYLTLELNKVRKLNIERAPIANFVVSSYTENNVEVKEIVCEDSNVTLSQKHINPYEVILTKPIQIDEYEYVYLNQLEVGTKLSATYYETIDGIEIYGFYLRSYIDEII